MRFTSTGIDGAQIVDIEPRYDRRGYFARTRCEREFAAHGLCGRMVQDSVSFNEKKGTLRGLHYHAAPFKQARLVRCLSGSAFFAVLDLRSRSPSYLRHVEFTLEAASHRAIYVVSGCALGFQTLEPATTVFYQMPEFYAAEYERGVRWNDPAFAIAWPDDARIILERDANYPDFDSRQVAELE